MDEPYISLKLYLQQAFSGDFTCLENRDGIKEKFRIEKVASFVDVASLVAGVCKYYRGFEIQTSILEQKEDLARIDLGGDITAIIKQEKADNLVFTISVG